MTGGAIKIAPLTATSPTLAEDMRLCGLRAGLSAQSAADEWVLHDPRMWLGTVFHRLMERARGGLQEEQIPAAWDEEVGRFVEAARVHPLDCRNAVPEEWPGYQLARVRSLHTVAKILEGRKAAVGKRRPPAEVKGVEQRLSARNGELVGKPDFFSAERITDYKSSLPQDGSPWQTLMLARYRRQLEIYAAIIAEVTGQWVPEGLIQSGSGESLSFQLVPAVCEHEADVAVAMLHAWNEKFEKFEPKELASVGAEQCGQCRFQPICPAFWDRLGAGELAIPSGRVAAVGDLVSAQHNNDPDIVTLVFRSLSSTNGRIATPAVVIRQSIHGSAILGAIGSAVRISNAILRSDGRLRADRATILIAEREVPTIVASAPRNRARVVEAE